MVCGVCTGRKSSCCDIAVVIEDIGEAKATPIAGKVLKVALEKTAE